MQKGEKKKRRIDPHVRARDVSRWMEHEGTKAVSRKGKDLITKNGVSRDAEKCLAPGRNLIKIIEAATEQIITREGTFSLGPSLFFPAWKLSLQLVNCWISRRGEEISIEIGNLIFYLPSFIPLCNTSFTDRTIARSLRTILRLSIFLRSSFAQPTFPTFPPRNYPIYRGGNVQQTINRQERERERETYGLKPFGISVTQWQLLPCKSRSGRERRREI